LIYRTIVFGHRKGFGSTGYFIGVPEGVPGGHRQAVGLMGQRGEAHQPTRGLVRLSTPCPRTKEGGKEGGGAPKAGTPLSFPPIHKYGRGDSARAGALGQAPATWGALGAASPPPSTYIYERRERGNTPHDSQAVCGAPLPLVRPRSYFRSARRSLAKIVASPPSPRHRAAGTHLLLRPSC
jgi:hypothetical protein